MAADEEGDTSESGSSLLQGIELLEVVLVSVVPVVVVADAMLEAVVCRRRDP